MDTETEAPFHIHTSYDIEDFCSDDKSCHTQVGMEILTQFLTVVAGLILEDMEEFASLH